MIKHTPEPWRISDSQKNVITSDKLKGLAGCCGNYYKTGVFETEKDVANAERIVACVNAMKGIDNPEQWVAAAKRERKALALLKQSAFNFLVAATSYVVPGAGFYDDGETAYRSALIDLHNDIKLIEDEGLC